MPSCAPLDPQVWSWFLFPNTLQEKLGSWWGDPPPPPPPPPLPGSQLFLKAKPGPSLPAGAGKGKGEPPPPPTKDFAPISPGVRHNWIPINPGWRLEGIPSKPPWEGHCGPGRVLTEEEQKFVHSVILT